MRLIIVGGGTAGWLTAAVLHKNFNSGERPLIDIVLVEPANIGRIGVGEATIPTLRRTLAYLGIPEADFLRATQATLKHGIRFADWAEPGHVYYHPFEAFSPDSRQTAINQWLARRAQGHGRPFAYDLGVQAYAADARRSPKLLTDPDYAGYLNYAYHLDAELLGDYLRAWCLERGVTRLTDEVLGADLHAESGAIEGLRLRSGACEQGDFFVDCSGFAALLIKGAMGARFESYAQHLICDRAVAIQTAYPAEPDEIDPFTASRALSAGWAWEIGLRTRYGRGYVYSSAHVTDDDAEQEFRATFELDAPSRLLRFDVGRREQSWVKNCVAIGLASGFIEPLESTGIFLIEEAVRLFARSLPLGGIEPAVIAAYNRYMNRLYDEIRDFVVAHYCLSRRRDSAFWRDVTEPDRVPDGLARLLEAWQSRPPIDEDLASAFLFNAQNYRHILFGMEWLPPKVLERAGLTSSSELPDGLDIRRAEALRRLPGHMRYLQAAAGSAG